MTVTGQRSSRAAARGTLGGRRAGVAPGGGGGWQTGRRHGADGGRAVMVVDGGGAVMVVDGEVVIAAAGDSATPVARVPEGREVGRQP